MASSAFGSTHLGEHRRDRQIDLFVRALELQGLHTLAQHGRQPVQVVRALARPASEHHVELPHHYVREIVIAGGRAQQIGINLRGVDDIRRATSQNLKKLGIVHDLRPLRVRKQRYQRLQRLALFIHPHRPAFPGLRRHFDRRHTRSEPFRFALPGLQIKPNCQRRPRRQLRQIAVKLLYGRELHVIGLDRRLLVRRSRRYRLRAQIFQQRIESQFPVQRRQQRHVRLTALQTVEIQSHRHIRRDLRQLLRQQHLLPLLLQSLAISFVGHLCGMVQGALHVAVFLNQLRRSFFADSFGSGDVVDAVAEQRHVVHDLLRRHSQNFLHFRSIDDHVVLHPAGSRPQHANAVADQLHHVFVVRDQQYIQLLFRALLRQRAQNIVGFKSVVFQNRHLQRFAQTPHVRDLQRQFVRHRSPMLFVFLEKFVAECRLVGIKHHAKVVRLIVFQQPLKNIVEQEGNFRRKAGRRIHAHHGGKKRPVDVRHGINQKQFFRSGGHPAEYSKARNPPRNSR
jgi:hypothetical protein